MNIYDLFLEITLGCYDSLFNFMFLFLSLFSSLMEFITVKTEGL